MTIWERSEVLLDGIRGLARAIDAIDSRVRVQSLEGVVVAEAGGGVGLGGEAVIVEESGEGGEDEEEDHGMQLDVESPDTVIAVDRRLG